MKNQTPDKSKLDFDHYKTTTSAKKEYQGLKRENKEYTKILEQDKWLLYDKHFKKLSSDL